MEEILLGILIEKGKTLFDIMIDKKKYKDIFLNPSSQIFDTEQDDNSEFSSQINILFSKENLNNLFGEIKSSTGFGLEKAIRDYFTSYFGQDHDEGLDRFIDYYINVIKNDMHDKFPEKYRDIFLEDFKKEVKDKFDSICSEIAELKNLFKPKFCYTRIEDIDNEIKQSASFGIDLDFFYYAEKAFDKSLQNELNEKEIHIKVKYSEEGLYYILSLLRKLGKEDEVIIIRSKEEYEKVKGFIYNKIVIPRYKNMDIPVTYTNTCIYFYAQNDFIGDKNKIELKPRLYSEIYSNLYKNYNIESDEAAKLLRETKMCYPIFKRKVFSGKARSPLWGNGKNEMFVFAMLLGRWSDCVGDKLLIEGFTGKKYAAFYDGIKSTLRAEDPFIIERVHHGTREYYIANIVESWQILLDDLTEEKVNNYIDVTKEILFICVLDDDKIKHEISTNLKRGMLINLIMLFEMGIKTQHDIDAIVGEILDKINTKELWSVYGDYYTLLAEISPKSFISKCNQDIEILKDIFNEPDHNYTLILHALDMLLTDKEYVHKSIAVMSELVNLHTKYFYTNRPLNSISNALQAWFNPTQLTPIEKVEVLNKLSNKDYAWKLIESVLPASTGSTGSNPSKYKYRLDLDEERTLYRNEVSETYSEYIKIGLDVASGHLKRLGYFFPSCYFIDFGYFDYFKKLAIEALLEATDNEKYVFSKEIRECIHNNRKYRNDVWNLSEEHCEMLINDIYSLIEYNNKYYEHLYLFDDYDIKTFNPQEDDYHIESEFNENIRRSFIEKNKAKGEVFFAKIFLLTQNSAFKCGYYVAEIVSSEINYKFIEMLITPATFSFYDSYIQYFYEKDGLKVYKDLFERDIFDTGIKAKLMSRVKPNDELVEYIDSQSSEFKEKYYGLVNIYHDMDKSRFSDKNYNKFIEYLYNYKNYNSILHHYFETKDIKTEELIRILQVLLLDKENKNYRDDYYIDGIMKTIYDRHYDNEAYEPQMVEIEYNYFNEHSHYKNYKYLRRYCSRNPHYVFEKIKMCFIPRNIKKEDYESPYTQDEISQAYRLLFGFNFCPGRLDDNSFDLDLMREWIMEYLKLAEENYRYAVSEQKLGEFLSSTVEFNNPVFYDEVCIIYEEYYSEDIMRGFNTGWFNSRGVRTVTDGDGEKKLAEKYSVAKEKLKITYPKMYDLVSDMESSLFKQAKTDRMDAEHGWY